MLPKNEIESQIKILKHYLMTIECIAEEAITGQRNKSATMEDISEVARTGQEIANDYLLKLESS